MALGVKRGVRLPPAVAIYRAAEQAYAELGATGTITSGMEGQHGLKSRHYIGLALDFRTRYLNGEQRRRLHARISALLPDDYDVVLEPTHLHVEYDPSAQQPEAQAHK